MRVRMSHRLSRRKEVESLLLFAVDQVEGRPCAKFFFQSGSQAVTEMAQKVQAWAQQTNIEIVNIDEFLI